MSCGDPLSGDAWSDRSTNPPSATRALRRLRALAGSARAVFAPAVDGVAWARSDDPRSFARRRSTPPLRELTLDTQRRAIDDFADRSPGSATVVRSESALHALRHLRRPGEGRLLPSRGRFTSVGALGSRTKRRTHSWVRTSWRLSRGARDRPPATSYLRDGSPDAGRAGLPGEHYSDCPINQSTIRRTCSNGTERFVPALRRPMPPAGGAAAPRRYSICSRVREAAARGHLFLSLARRDAEFADRLGAALESRGSTLVGPLRHPREPPWTRASARRSSTPLALSRSAPGPGRTTASTCPELALAVDSERISRSTW